MSFQWQLKLISENNLYQNVILFSDIMLALHKENHTVILQHYNKMRGLSILKGYYDCIYEHAKVKYRLGLI